MQRHQLLEYLDQLLAVHAFRDYCPLGLQVEGSQVVTKIVTSVTASLRAINFAVRAQAQMLLVHHGMFWQNESSTITGWKKRRIQTLLESNISLVAYHLPLDTHPQFGNNAQLAELMHWKCLKTVGEQGLLWVGELEEPSSTLAGLVSDLEKTLNRAPLVVGDLNQSVTKIAWCTGAAEKMFLKAVNEKVDAFITGEVSEAYYHLANECGVAFIAAGHHATERYGVRALGQHIQEVFPVEVIFFDEENPI